MQSIDRNPDASAVTMDWATVGDTNNPPDPTVMMTDGTSGYGSVSYTYQIGKYDVTNSQYACSSTPRIPPAPTR